MVRDTNYLAYLACSNCQQSTWLYSGHRSFIKKNKKCPDSVRINRINFWQYAVNEKKKMTWKAGNFIWWTLCKVSLETLNFLSVREISLQHIPRGWSSLNLDFTTAVSATEQADVKARDETGQAVCKRASLIMLRERIDDLFTVDRL